MADSHTFEHNGYTVKYFPSTVRAEMRRNRYLVGLITFYGYEDGADALAKDPEEWENYKEFSNGMAQCETDAPWYVGSMASPQQIGDAYELFMTQGDGLYFKFQIANGATLPPKKTPEITPQTSESLKAS